MWKPSITTEDVIRHSALKHSAKGSTWKKHKYIRKEGDTYIYKEDVSPDAADTKKLHDQSMKKFNAQQAAKAAQERGEQQTQRENINKASDFRSPASSNNAAVQTAREAQKKGFKRTINERDKQLEKTHFPYTLNKTKYGLDSPRESLKTYAKEHMAATKSAKAAQERGKRRTEEERAKRLREERNAEGRNAVKRQQNEARAKNRAGKYRGAVNKLSNDNLRESREIANLKKSKYTGDRLYAKERAYQYARDYENERKARKARRTADRVYTKNLMRESSVIGPGKTRWDYTENDPRGRDKAKGKRPARLDVAAKQAKSKMQAEAYRTGYKARKAAKNAAKSVSTAAREAWNTASSYKDRFADFESFYKWYKKNRK